MVFMHTNTSLRNSLVIATAFTGFIWAIALIEFFTGLNLYYLGIQPRSATGLMGIVTAPLIHGSWEHLSANTLPIWLLGSVLLYGYPQSRWRALGIIWLVSGIGVWLFARQSYHFGASGLTHGMFFYLFVIGILRQDKRSIALLMIAFFMYGTMLLTIFPRDPAISFEYHFFGAMGGTLCAFLFRYTDPMPERRKYSWEEEEEEEKGSTESGEEMTINSEIVVSTDKVTGPGNSSQEEVNRRGQAP